MPVKILIAFNKYEYRGGEDTYVNGLSELLKRKGHIVIPYFKDSRSLRSFKDRLLGLIGLFWSFSTAKEVNNLIDKYKPDVIHIHNI